MANPVTKKLILLGSIILFILVVGGVFWFNPGEVFFGSNSPTPNPLLNKKIYWVDSYHPTYPWSVDIETGMREVLKDSEVELKIYHLDMKRNPSEAYALQTSMQVYNEILQYKPDVIIASDDNAQKWLITRYFKDSPIPIVFCGVNWDAAAYNYSPDRVTGMLEIDLVPQLIDQLKSFSKGSRVGIVVVDDLTERKNMDYFNKLFFDGQLQIFWVGEKTQAEYQKQFLLAQSSTDMVIVHSNGGINDWDERTMRQFFIENTRVPTGGLLEWMAPYALMTLSKAGTEQGRWTAETALKIIQGTPVNDLPITHNKEGNLWINLDIADRLKIIFPPSVLKIANPVEELAQP